MNNMQMWPVSNNSPVQPPVIRKMPERSKKVRRKEPNESKKTEKLSGSGAVMTCSLCHIKGHNKRGCPTDPSQTAPTQSQSQANRNNGRANKRRME
ncbi:hypothetical protein RND71_023003 [Anisodus tanguticus]|uniref:Uncharacterized protein n=1 Tax=Anisodus tanguticus TaxID=243964 RepID=A0AAE1RUT9_9SOLA|nr:hypothetical protein RND71_023003 [Anisodus tanguticus]